MNAVTCHALRKSFGHVTALHGLELEVAEGSVFGLLGPNGAGKTTAIRMLTTLLPPSSGSASVCGHDVVREAEAVRRSIGYVPQVLSAEGALSGYENLLVFAKLYDVPRAQRRDAIATALDAVGLGDASERLVRTYSGGMVRRLEIAQALLHHPRVLFLDEPTIGLDPVARRTTWQHLERLRREHRMTVVLTTHYMEEADGLCDRIAILHQGNLVAQGSPDELRAATGIPDATLEDAFAHFTGAHLEGDGDGFAAARAARRTARRMM